MGNSVLRDVDRLVMLPGLMSCFIVKPHLSNDPRVRRLMNELEGTDYQKQSPEEQDHRTRNVTAELQALGYKADQDFIMMPAFRWMTPEEERAKVMKVFRR